jgi:hypothetical protein
MKCGQEKCANDSEYRYVWPGDGKVHEICFACLPGLVRLAVAMNVRCSLQRIATIEARKAVIRTAFALWRLIPQLEGDHPSEMKNLLSAVENLVAEEARSIEVAATIDDALARVVALRDAQIEEAESR